MDSGPQPCLRMAPACVPQSQRDAAKAAPPRKHRNGVASLSFSSSGGTNLRCLAH